MFSGKVVEEFPVDKEMFIGRDPSVDITIDNLGVSRKHAKVEIEDSEVYVSDLGSNNGTFVNGKPIVRHHLQHGDEITLGKYCLVYKSDMPPAASEPERAAPQLSEMTMGIDLADLEKMQEQSARPQKMSLSITRPNNSKVSYPLTEDQAITIGSSRDRDLYVPGWRVAKLHAVLVKLGNKVRIISSKKTLLNGRAVEDANVKPGDVIQIGKTYLAVQVEKEGE